jgi:hypothetical protein
MERAAVVEGRWRTVVGGKKVTSGKEATVGSMLRCSGRLKAFSSGQMMPSHKTQQQ